MTTLVFADPFGILDGLKNILINFVTDLINQIAQGITSLLQALFSFIQSMPLAYTTQNQIVMQGWRIMTVTADALLGLFILIGTIQILYGQTTRSLEMPLSQFLGRAILTALLIHLSAFFGETLLTLNNAIAAMVGANIGDFIKQLNGGNGFSQSQNVLFAAIIALIFAIGVLRLSIQGIKRIILFNLLFVLSGPAYLLSFHPYTQPVFSSWARRFMAVSFEQCIQFLGLGLGIRFLLATQQTGLVGFVIAIAMLNLALEIPSLVSHLVGGGPPVGLRDNSIVPIAVGAAVVAARFA